MEIRIAEGIRSILILEDEGLVSMMIEDLVRDMGCRHVYTCADLETARGLAQTAELDCAILDIRVRGGESGAIADILSARGVPFIFSTAGLLEGIPSHHRHRPTISKPFGEDEFKTLLLDTWMDSRTSRPGQPTRVATAAASD